MKPEVIGNITLNHHTQFITLTDSDNADIALVVHIDDVPKLIKQLKKVEKEMHLDTAQRKANGS